MMVVLLLVGLLCGVVQAGELTWPLTGHRILTGGFADTRPDHFHGGVDLRTQGEALPVVAPTDGWIERISVTPPGYGRTLYYRLDDGRTAVFGHLSRFVPVLEQMFRDSEVVAGTFRVDALYSDSAHERQFKRGDVLAYTGSTGVGPPHCHFEVREGAVQTDPLANFEPLDRQPPIISSVSWTTLSAFSPTASGKRLPSKGAPRVIRADEPIAFFVQATDPGPWGRNATPSVLRVRVDGQIVYADSVGRIDLIGPRNIYQESAPGGRKGAELRRVFHSPPPPEYFDAARDGKGWLADLNDADVRVEVVDRAGNASEVRLAVSCGSFPKNTPQPLSELIKAGPFCLETHGDPLAAWVSMAQIGPQEVRINPAGYPFGDRLRLSYCDVKPGGHTGLFLYQRFPNGAMKPQWGWSTQSDDTLCCLILRAGTYGIGQDHQPPDLRISAKGDHLIFRMTDDMSGPDDRTMRCTVDGHTAIPEFEYEERGGAIWTQEPLERGLHEVEFSAADRGGNSKAWHETVRLP